MHTPLLGQYILTSISVFYSKGMSFDTIWQADEEYKHRQPSLSEAGPNLYLNLSVLPDVVPLTSKTNLS